MKCTDPLVLGTPRLVVGLENLRHSLRLEVGPEHLVLAREDDAREAVKFGESDGRWRVERDDAHDGGLDERRRPEVVPPDLHDVVHLRVQLNIDRQAIPERVARAGHEAHGELSLEHEDGDAENWALGKQLENDRGRNLAGSPSVIGARCDLEKLTRDALDRGCWRCRRRNTASLS